MVNMVCCRLTTQAQRPGARDATIATTTLPPGSLQRMVRRTTDCQVISQAISNNLYSRPLAKKPLLACWQPIRPRSVAWSWARPESAESQRHDGQSPDCD